MFWGLVICGMRKSDIEAMLEGLKKEGWGHEGRWVVTSVTETQAKPPASYAAFRVVITAQQDRSLSPSTEHNHWIWPVTKSISKLGINCQLTESLAMTNTFVL